MAYVEDTIWCHPKFTDLSSEAFAAWVRGVAYSSGMLTRGRLSPAQQRIVGGTPRVRKELIAARLWDENGSGIVIHDWEDHNSQRDARKGFGLPEKGSTYVVQAGENGPVKIGHTRGDVGARVRSLQTGSPTPLRVVLVLEGADQETILHERFADWRRAGEWFDPRILDLLEAEHV